jgi:hypothetical protein
LVRNEGVLRGGNKRVPGRAWAWMGETMRCLESTGLLYGFACEFTAGGYAEIGGVVETVAGTTGSPRQTRGISRERNVMRGGVMVVSKILFGFNEGLNGEGVETRRVGLSLDGGLEMDVTTTKSV